MINEDVRKRIREAAERVRSGEFAAEWVEEYNKGMPVVINGLKENDNSLEQKVADELRELIERGKPKNDLFFFSK